MCCQAEQRPRVTALSSPLQIKMKDGKGEQSFALVNAPFL
jgi:hypothetical protein